MCKIELNKNFSKTFLPCSLGGHVKVYYYLRVNRKVVSA